MVDYWQIEDVSISGEGSERQLLDKLSPRISIIQLWLRFWLSAFSGDFSWTPISHSAVRFGIAVGLSKKYLSDWVTETTFILHHWLIIRLQFPLRT